MNNVVYQQGDCLLKKVGIHNVFQQEFESIPLDAQMIKTNLVLKGEMNSHALYGGKFEILKKNEVTFVRVLEETELDHVKDHSVGRDHAEHHAQRIAPGEYFVDQVLEYDHLKEESRRIID